MKSALIALVLIAGPAMAQNGKWNVDPSNDGPAQRQARMAACFRDTLPGPSYDARLDHCLKEAR